MVTLDEQLRTLRRTIVFKPPFCSGTVSVDEDELLLFYGKENGTPGRINFNHPTDDALATLSDTCDPATFGRGDEDVLDESYRRAGKLDGSCFAAKLDLQKNGLLEVIHTELLEGWNTESSIYAELYKLNVYGPGSFFKSHKDTPRGESMFGSLVIVYPTQHEGGALTLRDGDDEWTVDSAQAISAADEGPCVAYMAFYGDVDHEVARVVSGYRVTVTYNLYYTETNMPSSLTQYDTDTFKTTLGTLLDDPTFLPRGGHLGFGLRRVYPAMKDPNVRKSLKYLKRYLKGSDANTLKACDILGLSTGLWQLVQGDFHGYNYTLLLASVIRSNGEVIDDDYLFDVLIRECGAIRINCISFGSSDSELSDDEEGPEMVGPRLKDNDDEEVHPIKQKVEWVTRPTCYNERQEAFAAHGNEPSLVWAYGYFVLIAQVGPFGKRATKE